jgi:hypothetical protein
MWHTVLTLLKEKGEEGKNKKYFAKKMERRKSKLQALKKRTQERIEKDFFFGFCDFMNFFWDFWVIFAVRCLRITDFVSFPFCTFTIYIAPTVRY